MFLGKYWVLYFDIDVTYYFTIDIQLVFITYNRFMDCFFANFKKCIRP